MFLLSVSNSLLPQGTRNKANQLPLLSSLSAPIHVKHWGADLRLFLKNGAQGKQRAARKDELRLRRGDGAVATQAAALSREKEANRSAAELK